MSEDNKGNGDVERNDVDRKDVCRDYLNNICNRGTRCKFYHPTKPDAEKKSDDQFNFCIDFQNQGCFREHCKFVHAHSEDVERYKRSGDITIGLARAIAACTDKKEINGIPFCKEFQNGHCSRGPNRCRYWHINIEEERARRHMGARRGGFATHGMRRNAPYEFDDYGPPTKRGAYGSASYYPPPPPAPSGRYVQDLEHRNMELATEVEALKRELAREKERYEQLAASFYKTNVPAPVPPAAMPPNASWDSKYSWQ